MRLSGDLGPFERILTVTVDADAVEASKAKAARKLSRDMKLKGFRPGTAPRKVVEAAVGADVLRREAIEEALGGVVLAALAEAGLEPATPPRVEEMRDREDSGVDVDIRVTVWPEIEKAPEYRGRRVEVTSPHVDESDVAEHIDRMRDQFAELEDVSREAFDGDYVLVDVKTKRGDEELSAGSTNDLLYEVGSGAFLDGMDEALRGKAAGHIAGFDATLPAGMGEHGGSDVSVQVLVKQVKRKRLPELTDEWVNDVSEYSSVDDLDKALAEQLSRVRLAAARSEFEEKLLETLRGDVTIEIPDDLVAAEMDVVLRRFARRLAGGNVTLADYLEVTGQDEDSFVADLRSQAILNIETRVFLEAVAKEEKLDVSEEDVADMVATLASATDMSVEDYRKALEEGGQEKVLAGDILRRKAVARLLEVAIAVDADGKEIEFPEPDVVPGAEAGEGDEPELAEDGA
jgi:trigger factor